MGIGSGAAAAEVFLESVEAPWQLGTRTLGRKNMHYFIIISSRRISIYVAGKSSETKRYIVHESNITSYSSSSLPERERALRR